MMYKEIFKLKEMLENESIPFEFGPMNGGYHISYPEKYPDCICSVIEHDGSYGRYEDLLEILGLQTDEELKDYDVLGCVTAENVFTRIKKHHEEEQNA